jgi:hypothetical protein
MRLRTALMTGVLALILSLLVGYPLPASAAGSTTIAGAPSIPIGVQQFGNTADGSQTSGSCGGRNYSQYWSLPVVAGDQVTVTWQADNLGTYFYVLPIGTTDFNVGDTSPERTFTLNSNGMAEAVFPATRTGTMPLRFYVSSCGRDPGPYAFTAYVSHAVVVDFARPGSLPLTGTLQVTAHNPDGVPITSGVSLDVQARRGEDPWTTVGSAAASGSPTPVGYVLPKEYAGEKVQIKVLANGAGYTGATSAVVSFTASGTSGGKGGKGGGGKVKISLKASPKKVGRLDTVHLRGKTSAGRGARVTILQKQAGGSAWQVEGRTKVSRSGGFGYSEVIHSGSRSYKACIGTTCSKPVLVRFLG